MTRGNRPTRQSSPDLESLRFRILTRLERFGISGGQAGDRGFRRDSDGEVRQARIDQPPASSFTLLLMKMLYLCCAVLLTGASCAAGPDSRPNFVVILADDLGYGDIAAYGSERNLTPHLDRMAEEGLRFTDFHSNGPMCTPTRAALLTGLYPQRFGDQFESALSGIDDYDIGLPHNGFTIAEAMAEVGYATGMYGKWHLGYHPPFMPSDQGFSDFRGLASGDGDHHSHIDRSGRRDWWHNSEIQMEEGYGVDLITKHSVEFIKRHRAEPFFLYVAHLAIHFPWQGPLDRGYRVEGGNYHSLTKLGDLDSFDVSSQVKEMIEAVDGSVGEILAAVRESGLESSTLIFFTSDNGGYLTYQGGYHNISENGPLRGQKTDLYEGGHRVPAIARWLGRIQPGTSHELAATFDLFPTIWELSESKAEVPPFDGTSLVPVLFDRLELAPRTLFWRMRSDAAVRRGQWKFVRNSNKSPELYNLSQDVGEKEDLAESLPEVVEELSEALMLWEGAIDGNRR